MKDGIWGNGPKAWIQGATGDDPTVRQVHAALAEGPGTGLGFFFLFGLKRHRETDQQMLQRELEAVHDDVDALRRAGYTVIVDPQATRKDLLEVLQGVAEAPPAGIYWSAHGHPDGGVEACDGDKIPPSAVAEIIVAPALRLFVMSACYSASRARTWRKALGGGPLVVGWGRPVTIDRAVDFLTPDQGSEHDFDDLIQRYLVQGQPIPPEQGEVADKAAWTRGTISRIEALVPSLAEALDAAWRNEEGALQLRTPTAEGRSQVVRLSVVQGDQPFYEGQDLLAAESEVGELTGVIDPALLLRQAAAPGLCRVVLVDGPADLPVVLVQGFLPMQGASLSELAGVVQEVALRADRLENEIFGGDFG